MNKRTFSPTVSVVLLTLAMLTFTLGASGGTHRSMRAAAVSRAQEESQDIEGQAAAPAVSQAQPQGKNNLLVTGTGFSKHAVVLISGNAKPTKNIGSAKTTELLAKGALKGVAKGQTVTVQVKNADGTLSNTIMFTR